MPTINMVDILLDDGISPLVDEEKVKKAVDLSCFKAKNLQNCSLCVRFAKNEVVKTLNATWRKQDKVTDVLSFPMQDDELNAEESLGDMILAANFVAEEAKRLDLSVSNHCLHLIVHGTLHLLGYDHIHDDEALVMQSLENNIMLELGLHVPYPELIDEVV